MYLNKFAISSLSKLQQGGSADNDAHRDRHIHRRIFIIRMGNTVVWERKYLDL